MESSSPLRIFVSYSRRGNGLARKTELLQALGVLARHHLLDIWEDGRIPVGANWHGDIKQAMDRAALAVVLLTREALESEYILKEEFPVLRERQQRDKLPVFPVICEPCGWRNHAWLRATQLANEGNPLSELSEAARERVLRKLATDIAHALSRLALGELAPPSPLGEEVPAGVRGVAATQMYLDKLPLTRGPGLRAEKLIGREQELALLDLALTQAHTAIVSLVAWGGVGKTMLVQHWLQSLEREAWFGARRVYGWSFYSQGMKEDRQASEDTFLSHALAWFGVPCKPTLSPWDKGRLLADAVAHERTLLILDGVEPLQYPPGPRGGQLRAPGVHSLLKHLAWKANAAHSLNRLPPSGFGGSLCVVTTREALTDLAGIEHRPEAAWGSVLRVELGNLSPEAGAALLHHTGANRAGGGAVKPDDNELLEASVKVEGHALTLNLLGRFLASAHGGDIRHHRLVRFEDADRRQQGGTTFKMLAAFEHWFAAAGEFELRSLTILRMLGLFDRPADAGSLAALRQPPALTELTEPLFAPRIESHSGRARTQPLPDECFHAATAFLADFGLVTRHAAAGRHPLLDCHPLIREYFSRNLRQRAPEAKKRAHARLYDYYVALPSLHAPRTLEQMEPLFLACLHGCQAELHERVLAEVYRARIQQAGKDEDKDYCIEVLGAVQEQLSAQAAFFTTPYDPATLQLRPEHRPNVRH